MSYLRGTRRSIALLDPTEAATVLPAIDNLMWDGT